MSKKIFNHLYSLKLEIFVIFLSLLTRYYNVFNRYSLGYESIRDANVAVVGANQLQLPLTGPFSSLGSFTFGPWYWYQLIFFHLLFPFGYSSWIYLGISSTVFILLLFKIGELIDDKSLGIIIALLAIISRYIVSWSTFLSNPALIFPYAALSIWIFLRILKKGGSYWWGFSLGVSIGIGINTHYEMAAYILFLFALLFYKPKKYLYFVAGFIGLLLTFLPLLFFDLLNHWHTLNAILFSLSDMKNRIYVPNSWRIYLLDFWPSSWAYALGLPKFMGNIVIAYVSIILIYLTLKFKIAKNIIILTILFAIMSIQLRYYSGERNMSYIHYLIPFIFIYTGYTIWIWKKLFAKGIYLASALFLILFILCLPSFIQEFRSSKSDTYLINFTKAIIIKYPDKKFTVLHCTKDDADSKSILFLLNKENKISPNGIKIALDNNSCIKRQPIFIQSNISKVTLNDKYKLLLLDSITDSMLSKSNWVAYTMDDLYRNSALWWFSSNLQ